MKGMNVCDEKSTLPRPTSIRTRSGVWKIWMRTFSPFTLGHIHIARAISIPLCLCVFVFFIFIIIILGRSVTLCHAYICCYCCFVHFVHVQLELAPASYQQCQCSAALFHPFDTRASTRALLVVVVMVCVSSTMCSRARIYVCLCVCICCVSERTYGRNGRANGIGMKWRGSEMWKWTCNSAMLYAGCAAHNHCRQIHCVHITAVS